MFPQRKNDLLITLGDSWMNDIRFRSGMGTAPWLLQMLPMLHRPVRFINRAYGGQTLFHSGKGALGSFDAEVAPLYDAANKSNIVVIYSGSNDTNASGSSTPDDLFAKIEEIVAKSTAAGFATCVCTFFAYLAVQDEVGPTEWFLDSDAEIKYINGLIRQMPGIHVIDFGADPIMGVQGVSRDPTYFQTDWTHPNATGNAILAGIAAEVVNGILGQ
jgi:hypothetical protein